MIHCQEYNTYQSDKGNIKIGKQQQKKKKIKDYNRHMVTTKKEGTDWLQRHIQCFIAFLLSQDSMISFFSSSFLLPYLLVILYECICMVQGLMLVSHVLHVLDQLAGIICPFTMWVSKIELRSSSGIIAINFTCWILLPVQEILLTKFENEGTKENPLTHQVFKVSSSQIALRKHTREQIISNHVALTWRHLFLTLTHLTFCFAFVVWPRCFSISLVDGSTPKTRVPC